MSRSAAQVRDGMLALLPPGWAWPRSDDSSLLAAVLSPMSAGIADLEANAEAVMAELDPRTASAMLADFERVLGADPCGLDLTEMETSERQRLAYARFVARGGASRRYFQQIAAYLGVYISIAEAKSSQIGEMECGDELLGDNDYTWVVTLPLGNWTEFELGSSSVGDGLYAFTASPVECEIRRRAPAHTTPVFIYREAAGAGADAINLLSAAAATGEWVEVAGGAWWWTVLGSWDGAEVILQWSPDGGGAVLFVDDLVADGAKLVVFAAGKVRVAIAGGGAVALSSDLRGPIQ